MPNNFDVDEHRNILGTLDISMIQTLNQTKGEPEVVGRSIMRGAMPRFWSGIAASLPSLLAKISYF